MVNKTESKKKEAFSDIDNQIDGLESPFDIDYIVNYFDTYMSPKFKKKELRETFLDDGEISVVLDKKESFRYYKPNQLEFEDRLSKIPVDTYDDDFI